MSNRAVILAGGRGTRLRPYTVVLPKPLMPIGEYPILEVLVRQLVSSGFSRITMAVNHQAEIIRAFFGDGKKWGAEIDYSLEDQPLSTMGPLRLIDDLPEDFLITNGDVLTDLDFKSFFEYHKRRKSLFTISSHDRTHVNDYGVIDVGEEGMVIRFREKPKTTFTVSMGVYAANRKILDFIPPNKPFGFDDLMYDLMRRGTLAIAKPHQGLWLDIGRADDYHSAIETFETNKNLFLRRV